MHILAELMPLDLQSGTRPVVRVCSGQIRELTGMGGQQWHPAILKTPVIGIELFDGDFTSPITPAQAAMDVSLAAGVALHANIESLIWSAAPITIYGGNIETVWPWPILFKGLARDFRKEASTLSLTLSVDTAPFEKDVLTLKYLGNGDAEGGADIKEKLKPWVLGKAKNVEPVLINSVDNIYQFSGYGPIVGVTTLYERASAFGEAVADYPSYAALLAAPVPAAAWASCNALGMIKLGAPAFGLITGDVEGDNFDGTFRRLTGAIIRRALQNAAIPDSRVDIASLAQLDVSVPFPINVVLTSQETILSFVQRLCLPCNTQAGVSLLGKLFTMRVDANEPTITLDAQGRSYPPVKPVTEVGASPPYHYIEFGADKCWRVHTADEIASADIIPVTTEGQALPENPKIGDRHILTYAGKRHEYIAVDCGLNAGGVPILINGEEICFFTWIQVGDHLADETATNQISVKPIADRIIKCNAAGEPLSGQFPDIVSIAVSVGSTSIKTDNRVQYNVDSEANVLSTINAVDGSPSKGDLTVTAITASEGVVNVTVIVDGRQLPAIRVRYLKQIGTANDAGGASAKTAMVTPNATVSGAAYVIIAPVATVGIASGEKLYVSAGLDYVIDGANGDARNATVKHTYKEMPSGTETDFAAGSVGTSAISGYTYVDGEGESEWIDAVQGHVSAAPAPIASLTIASYEVRTYAKLNTTGRTASFFNNIMIEAKP